MVCILKIELIAFIIKDSIMQPKLLIAHFVKLFDLLDSMDLAFFIGAGSLVISFGGVVVVDRTGWTAVMELRLGLELAIGFVLELEYMFVLGVELMFARLRLEAVVGCTVAVMIDWYTMSAAYIMAPEQIDLAKPPKHSISQEHVAHTKPKQVTNLSLIIKLAMYLKLMVKLLPPLLSTPSKKQQRVIYLLYFQGL